MFAAITLEDFRTRLGGDERLAAIGAYQFCLDPSHITFRLGRPNPNGVRTVSVSIEPDGLFSMDCFGGLQHGGFQAKHLANANEILPENLATVLGKLTGIDDLHHRHF